MGHYLLLVSVEPPAGYTTSEEIRRYVYETLMSDDSFVETSISRSLLFHDPIADYLTIGGNWSGLLVGKMGETDKAIGEDHDAVLVTWELYAEFLAEHEGHAVTNDDGMPVFVDLDDEDVNPGFVGRKWLVVVDYHV